MQLTLLIIGALLLSVTVNTLIKGVMYSNISEHGETEEPSNGIILTALGIVIVSNLIPLTLGALIGLYAII